MNIENFLKKPIKRKLMGKSVITKEKKEERKNFNQNFIWLNFVKLLKIVKNSLRDFSLKYPATSKKIQLSFIYFFALVDLTHSVLSNVFMLGYIPLFLQPFSPLLKSILNSSIFQIWASPEKVFFLSYVVIEFMVVRSVFKFSKLIKYNILLIFALLMVQGLIFSYWDLLFHREISALASKWAYDQGAIISTDKFLAIFFFFLTFAVFLFLYIYLYIQALYGTVATFPGMIWLTDSVSFWLRIKTPTMKFGKRKEK